MLPGLRPCIIDDEAEKNHLPRRGSVMQPGVGAQHLPLGASSEEINPEGVALKSPATTLDATLSGLALLGTINPG